MNYKSYYTNRIIDSEQKVGIIKRLLTKGDLLEVAVYLESELHEEDKKIKSFLSKLIKRTTIDKNNLNPQSHEYKRGNTKG